MSSKQNFKVVIAGGSVAGLTLANMLEKFDIDYVILEAHTDVAPKIGASLGLMPNGLRILDQLGLFDQIDAISNWPQGSAVLRESDGTPFLKMPCVLEHLRCR